MLVDDTTFLVGFCPCRPAFDRTSQFLKSEGCHRTWGIPADASIGHLESTAKARLAGADGSKSFDTAACWTGTAQILGEQETTAE